MLPLAHAALGLLAYAGVQLPRDWRAFTGTGVLAALLGSQFPDLVDKPLAYADLIPSGRSVAHSLLLVGLLGVALYAAVPAEWRTEALGFWVAALVHPFADARHALLDGGFADLPGYLLWPVTRAPRYGEHAAPWVRVLRIYSAPEFGTQTLLLVGAAGVLLAGRAAVALDAT
ncbi:metal-dependent hydrolase [Halarchaeum sp. P4]|uniref:metal-dependent hydrolase n=1 Tax=Halarchaeum sp. P4 TaxID=3421639 RepID=UPI003EC041ED